MAHGSYQRDVNHINIGNACSIQDGAILHVTHDGPYSNGGKPLILGQGITIAHQAVLHGCTIDDFCLIGMGALILDGVHIETPRHGRCRQSGKPWENA